MKLKQTISIITLACFTSLAPATYAGPGVPVFDGASIAKWADQLEKMNDQINQAKAHLEAISGSRGIGELLDNPAIKSQLPKDWQKLITEIKKTQSYIKERKKYPTVKGMPKTNAMYDVMASQKALMDDLYEKSVGRIQQVQDLMGQIDRASDPAAKADLTNRLINEQNAIQATSNLVNLLQKKQKQELEEATRQAQKEFMCREFKRSGC